MSRDIPLTTPLLGLVETLPSAVISGVVIVSDAIVVGLALATILEAGRAHRVGPLSLVQVAIVPTAAVLGSLVASMTIKVLTAVPRPCQYLDLALPAGCPIPPDWSFPSNHATLAAALGVVWWALHRRRRAGSIAGVVGGGAGGAVAAALAVTVAATRVVLGVHAVADVAVGLVLGTVLAALVLGCGGVFCDMAFRGGFRRAHRSHGGAE